MPLLFFIIAALVVIADQLTKAAVASHFLPDESRIVIPHVLYLTYVHNYRGAFGLFGVHPLGLAVAAAIIVVLFYLGYRQGGATASTHIAFGFILGGAIGNILDRVRFHYVVDFIYLRWWPVFNIADSAITVGVALLLVRMLWHERKANAAAGLASRESASSSAPSPAQPPV